MKFGTTNISFFIILLLTDIFVLYIAYKNSIIIKTTGIIVKAKVLSFFSDSETPSFANVEYFIDGNKKLSRVYVGRKHLLNYSRHGIDDPNEHSNSGFVGIELYCVYYLSLFGRDSLILKKNSDHAVRDACVFFFIIAIFFLFFSFGGSVQKFLATTLKELRDAYL